MAQKPSVTSVKYKLQCPYSDKDYVKRLGARWDPSAKTWWVTDTIYDSFKTQLHRWNPTVWDGSSACGQTKFPNHWKPPKPVSSQIVDTDHTNHMPHRYDIGKKCFAMGTEAEASFHLVAKGNGWNCMKTNVYADMNEHQDFVLLKSGQQFTVDVKAGKKIKRQDANVSWEWIWLELHGVRQSDPGWLMSPHGADWIAFESKEAFLIFDRHLLSQWIRTKYNPEDPVVTSASEAKYRIYPRRKTIGQIGYDKLMLARVNDMLTCPAFVAKWRKN